MEERLDVVDEREDDSRETDAALASHRQASSLRAAFNVGDDFGGHASSHIAPPSLLSSRKVAAMSAPAILEPKT